MINSDELIKSLLSIYDSGEALSDCMESEEIASLIQCDDAEVRIWVAKLLAYDNLENMAVQFLCQLAEDEDACVRVEAVDSLSAFSNIQSYHTLCHAMEDTDELVRSFAAFGIAVIGKKLCPDDAERILRYANSKETSDRARVGIYVGLYILGIREMLPLLMILCESDDYHVACSAMHALEEVLGPENENEIAAFINSLDAFAQPLAVVDTIHQLQDALTKGHGHF